MDWNLFAERKPERDLDRGEQTFLLWDERSGTFELAFFEYGWEFDGGSFLGATHWVDITHEFPQEKRLLSTSPHNRGMQWRAR
jgi:hypothetical protein